MQVLCRAVVWGIKDAHAPFHAGGFHCDSGISSCSFPGVTQESHQASDSGWRDARPLTGTVNDSSVCLFACVQTTGLLECMHVYMREGDGISYTHGFKSFGFGVQLCVFCSGLVGLNDGNEVSPHTTSSGTSLKAAELHHYL